MLAECHALCWELQRKWWVGQTSFPVFIEPLSHGGDMSKWENRVWCSALSEGQGKPGGPWSWDSSWEWLQGRGGRRLQASFPSLRFFLPGLLHHFFLYCEINFSFYPSWNYGFNNYFSLLNIRHYLQEFPESLTWKEISLRFWMPLVKKYQLVFHYEKGVINKLHFFSKFIWVALWAIHAIDFIF